MKPTTNHPMIMKSKTHGIAGILLILSALAILPVFGQGQKVSERPLLTGAPTEAVLATSHKLMAKERLRSLGLPTPDWLGPVPPGLPPLAGFMSKWQIFVGGFQTGNSWMIALVIFAALNSVLSLGYYAPLVNRMYRLKPSVSVETGQPTPFLMGIPLVVLSLLVVLLGFWPSLVNWITNPAAIGLLAAFGR